MTLPHQKLAREHLSLPFPFTRQARTRYEGSLLPLAWEQNRLAHRTAIGDKIPFCTYPRKV